MQQDTRTVHFDVIEELAPLDEQGRSPQRSAKLTLQIAGDQIVSAKLSDECYVEG